MSRSRWSTRATQAQPVGEAPRRSKEQVQRIAKMHVGRTGGNARSVSARVGSSAFRKESLLGVSEWTPRAATPPRPARLPEQLANGTVAHVGVQGVNVEGSAGRLQLDDRGVDVEDRHRQPAPYRAQIRDGRAHGGPVRRVEPTDRPATVGHDPTADVYDLLLHVADRRDSALTAVLAVRDQSISQTLAPELGDPHGARISRAPLTAESKVKPEPPTRIDPGSSCARRTLRSAVEPEPGNCLRPERRSGVGTG